MKRIICYAVDDVTPCSACANLARCPQCGSTSFFDGECMYCEDDDSEESRETSPNVGFQLDNVLVVFNKM